MQYSATKLHKVGEFGHGRVILCIYSGLNINHKTFQLSKELDKTKKIYCYFLDLNREKKHSDEALVELLNKFHFIKDLIVDFPTFIRIIENFQKIKLMQSGIDKLILFNPIKPRSSLIRRFFGFNYINLNNEIIKLNKKKLFQIYQFYKNFPEISIKKLDIIAIQDVRASIKIGSYFNNSRLRNFKTYDDALKEIHKIS